MKRSAPLRLLLALLAVSSLAVSASCNRDQRAETDTDWSVPRDAETLPDAPDDGDGGDDGGPFDSTDSTEAPPDGAEDVTDIDNDAPLDATDGTSSDADGAADTLPETGLDADSGDTASPSDADARSDADGSDADGGFVPRPWTRLVGGGYADRITDVAVGPGGDIYIAGIDDVSRGGSGTTGQGEPVVARYGPTGTRKWITRFGSSSNDSAKGLAIGPNGGIYVCGMIKKGLGGQTYKGGFGDAYVARFAPSGSLVWARLLSSTQAETATDIASDGSGAIYVTGSAQTALGQGTYNGGSTDAFLAKFDTSGNRGWVAMVGTGENDVGEALAADPVRGVYLARSAGTTLGGARDAILTAHDTSGSQRWAKTLGKDSEVQKPYGLAVDSAGAIYMAGETSSAIAGQPQKGARDYFLAKYQPTGTRTWVKVDGSAGPNGQAKQVATDVDVAGPSRVALTGWTDTGFAGHTHLGGAADLFFTAYDAQGTRTTVGLMGGGGEETGDAVATDAHGAHILVGSTTTGIHSQSYGGGRSEGMILYRP